MAHFLVVGLLVLVLVALITGWRKSVAETLYQSRNIGFLAVGTADILLIISLLADRILFYSDENEWKQVIDCLIYFPANFAHLAMIAIGVLGIAMFVSNLSLMKHEGMRPSNMVGTFLEVIQIVGTVVVYFAAMWIGRMAPSLKNPGAQFAASFIPLFFYCLLDYAECIILGIMIMGWLAARQTPWHDKDFIIILGCSISKTGGLLPLLRGRTNSAIRYAWEQEIANGKKVCYVPSGGQGSDEIMSEGSAMELYLLSHAAEEDEVFPEKKSTNTYENFKFSFELIDSMKENAKAAFATTNYHVLRSGMIVHQMGREVEAISSKTKWYFWPNGFAREVVAICVMTKKYHLMAAGVMAVMCALLLGLQMTL